MRLSTYAAAASLTLFCAIGQATAMPVDRSIQSALPTDIEQAQFVYLGRNYCWYDRGWRGPGFYWCGYAWRRGLGWGGGAGWRGWHHRGGHAIGRPVPRPGHGPIGRPGGRPGGHPGVGHPGGGRPGGGHPGGGHGRH
jgi:hypothetical protein